MQVSHINIVALIISSIQLFIASVQTEVWEGPKLNFDFCSTFLGIEKGEYVSHLPSFLTSFINENKMSGIQIWRDTNRPSRIVEDVMSHTGGSIASLDVTPILHHARLIKSEAEQELMRRSCSIIANSVIKTMKVRLLISGAICNVEQ